MFSHGSQNAVLVHYSYQLAERTSLLQSLVRRLSEASDPSTTLMLNADQLVDTAAQVSGLRRVVELADRATSPMAFASRVQEEAARWRQGSGQTDLERRQQGAMWLFWQRVMDDVNQGTFASLSSWRKEAK